MPINKIRRMLIQEHLFNLGDRILVGVSGGVDSLALLDILHRLSGEQDWSIFAAHFNHQFRGDESTEDAKYVEHFCEERNIPCKIGTANMPKIIQETRMNSQEASRKARFSFFRDTAKEWSITKLALAHHANDQAETVLMRVFRGTGMEGLAGIPRIREDEGFQIVRPLLSIYKAELVNYCIQNGIEHREDSSNRKKTYHRNFLRLEVIPWLEEKVNPSIQDVLIQLSQIAREENDVLDSMAREACQQIMKKREENKIIIEGKLFLNYHIALQRRMIKLIFTYLHSSHRNIGFIHIKHICEWMKEGRTSSILDLPNGVIVRKVYDEIIFTKSNVPSPPHPSFCYEISIPGRTYLKEIDSWVVVQTFDTPPPMNTQDTDCGWFDLGQIDGPLIVRNRRNGDRMSILGMQGSKKLKDILIDQKIPLAQREEVPILADKQGILWIPGVKRSNRALITKHTRQMATIYLEKDGLATGGFYAK